jgi:DNA topoisomerase-2
MSSSKSLSKTYQKKTDREHILDAPDTYIGSIEQDNVVNWIYDEKTESMEYKEYAWIPGLYKCFDEGIVNARDHKVRMDQKIESGEAKCLPVKNIDIGINKETGVITMINDGNGIDVAKHPEYELWIPEMIFGHLRTSTNYNKDEKKIVGGKNGFGFKLVLIYSTWGMIETVDHIRGLKYTQEYKNNLSEICPPKVTKCKGKPYTKVSWLPDYKRFGIEHLTNDMYNLLVKRTYDIAAVTDKSVKVKLNSTPIAIKSFEQYVNMYVGSKTDTKRIYEEANERWEYAVCLTPLDEFTQVSFVNGIYTSKGGKHVDYILNQITKNLCDYIEKKKKVKVKSNTIKEQLMLFVNCVVENPAFDSQTKDYMNTAVSKFGSSCKVSDKFIEKVAKLGVMEQAISLNEVKQTKEAKKTDGKKTKTVRGIPKLIDANHAGTAKSNECTLILCEGDSAKAGIVSGMSREDRNYFGVYPLKGKLMNIRDATTTKIANNNEISELKKIIGLETNKQYKTKDDVMKNLRYGKVMFMTDQDLDGTHIKGLCVNMFDSQWSDLIKSDSFIGFMNTPILKAKKGTTELCFYNDKEYEEWKKVNSTKGWKIKYYKGLGTSTAKEFKEYFANKRVVEFKFSGNDCSESLDMVFRKTRADDRKTWLGNYDKEAYLDTTQETISYSDFVNKELIHFSKYDNERSIPNLMDGLKTSLRKILYCAFKRNLTNEIKVAQFGGYVSEHSGYHHGENSLMKAIVGMAQEYVGSNNINLLLPNGQFGTRLQGGEDSASERYIFTQLNDITKKIFIESDNDVLNYLDDDGTPVEPEFYVPIIPMILVNGSKGIGTGFSTDIMCYNPEQIIAYLCDCLEHGKSDIEIEPYYEGFVGDIIKLEDSKYLFKGKYNKLKSDVIQITELPVGTWTDSYKMFLEKLIENESSSKKDDKKKKKSTPQIIKDYKDMSTDTKVDIQITFYPNKLEHYEKVKKSDYINGLEDVLNLTTTHTSTNMHMFNHQQKLKKYSTIYEIIEEFIEVRKDYYVKRKELLLQKMKKLVMLLTNKARFIQMQCDDKLDLRRKKKDQVIDMLETLEFDKIDDDEYKYLRSMPIDSVIEENIMKLLKERDQKQKEYDTLFKQTTNNMWLNELTELKQIYSKYKFERDIRQTGSEIKKIKKTKKTLKLKTKSKK